MPTQLHRFVLCISLLMAAAAGFSQETRFGFYLGPTRSTLNFEQHPSWPFDFEIDPYDFRTGYTIGGNFTWEFAENVCVRTEFNYERRGGKVGLTLSDGQGAPLPDQDVKDNFDYLQLPILFELSAGKQLRMHIHIGYSFAYLANHTSNFPDEIRVVTPGTTYAVLMPSDYRKTDHFLLAGVAASYPMEDGIYAQLAVRAYRGFKNLNLDEGWDVKNLSAAAVVGLQFRL